MTITKLDVAEREIVAAIQLLFGGGRDHEVGEVKAPRSSLGETSMKIFGLVLLTALGTWGEASAASFETGNKLLNACQSTDVVEQSYCKGYIAGIFDALDGNTLDQQHTACPPNKVVTVGQVSDIVVQWLQANPKDRHYAAAGLVAAAIAKAFPCR